MTDRSVLSPSLAGPHEAPRPARDLLLELGIRPVINAAGTYTFLTGSLMRPEVVDAWSQAAGRFVRLEELHDAVGRRMASLVGSDAAMVTAGAASALTLGTAACMAGSNESFIRQLPDTNGMPDEVLVQRNHRMAYDRAIRICGARLVEIESSAELAGAISGRTAMLFFLNSADPAGQIEAGEFAQIGRRHRIPTFIDCAADVPPVENLTRFGGLGFDLVTFSGGKGLQGPQSAGLLMGRRDLIEAARLQTVPYADTIGRGMKVNKEELLAMLVALESYLARDHRADWLEWERRVQVVADRLAAIPGVVAERFVPPVANHVPHLRLRWDPEIVRMTPAHVMSRLREGEPSIEVVPEPVEGLEVSVWMLQPGEVEVVGDRLAEVLGSSR